MSVKIELQTTIEDMVQPGKGILAADESAPTIKKRFSAIAVESSEEIRRSYRSMLLSTPGLGAAISGVILFEETLQQKDDKGVAMPLATQRAGIVVGIKVDKGLVELPGLGGEKITQGLDGLEERLATYKALGARFAKWRCVYKIHQGAVSRRAIEANAEVLARYAACCQGVGIVPIVEPEVLIDGEHDIEVCAQITEAVQRAVFNALYRHQVAPEYILLKPSMVLPGTLGPQVSAAQVGEATLAVLKRAVPAAVPSINFLSGGLTPEQATANLCAINQTGGTNPWLLSFSYGRALQEPVLSAWRGDSANCEAAQNALMLRARLNAEAVCG
jgi:fructose-bisphosphate aldolase class I